jgi:hypothetical protein
MGMKPIKLNNNLTVNEHLAKHTCLHVQQLFDFSIEIKFEIATEPAI